MYQMRTHSREYYHYCCVHCTSITRPACEPAVQLNSGLNSTYATATATRVDGDDDITEDRSDDGDDTRESTATTATQTPETSVHILRRPHGPRFAHTSSHIDTVTGGHLSAVTGGHLDPRPAS